MSGVTPDRAPTDTVVSVRFALFAPARGSGPARSALLEHRGDGLLGAAMDAARAQGARRLDALALPGDRATKNLYERAGVVARAIILSTRLDG